MKKLLFISLAVIASMAAFAQIETPQASPHGSVTSVVGLTDIKIDYYRPRLRGRKVFGEKDVMYPYGSIWRTGANNGTKISFSTDVSVEGINVPKGEYLIYTWPGMTEWTVALYKDLTLGGNTGNYKKENEAASFKVKPEKLNSVVETLTIGIDDIAADNKSAKISLAWENTLVKFTVRADYDAIVMKSIEANTKVNPDNYYTAAVYYLDSGKDLKQAMEWMNKADPVEFYELYQKARLQKAVGDKTGALATSKLSLEASKKANNADYQRMNEELQKSLK